jgi:hypothetical protein
MGRPSRLSPARRTLRARAGEGRLGVDASAFALKVSGNPLRSLPSGIDSHRQ